MKASASNAMTHTKINVAPINMTHHKVAIDTAAGPAVSRVDNGPVQPDSPTASPLATIGRVNQQPCRRVAFCRSDAAEKRE